MTHNAGSKMKVELTIKIAGNYNKNTFGIHVQTPSGESAGVFKSPFTVKELTELWYRYQGNQFHPLKDEVHPAEIGERLFRAIFQGSIKELYDRLKGEKPNAGLKIKIMLDPKDKKGYELLNLLPWEWLVDPTDQSFLSMSRGGSVVRHLMLPRASYSVEAFPTQLRILVVTASPKGLTPLDLDEAEEAIAKAIQPNPRLRHRTESNATLGGIVNALNDAEQMGKPFHVIHFIGHGGFMNGRGVLALEDGKGDAKYIDAQTFAEAVRGFETVKLIYLDACNTTRVDNDHPMGSVASQLIARGFPNVVGMRNQIGDQIATSLCQGFYSQIVIGKPLDEALTHARHMVQVAEPNSLAWSVPVLYTRDRAYGRVAERDWRAFRLVWTALAIALAYLTVTIYGQTQGWGLDFPSTEKEFYAASVYGLVTCIPLFAILLWMTIFYARQRPDQIWYARIPELFGIQWNYANPEAKVFQRWTFFICLILPAVGHIHFFSKLSSGTVYQIGKDQNGTKYTPVAVGWNHFRPQSFPKIFLSGNKYIYGSTNEPNLRIDFFPFYGPMVFLLLEVWLFYLFFKMLRCVFVRVRPG